MSDGTASTSTAWSIFTRPDLSRAPRISSSSKLNWRASDISTLFKSTVGSQSWGSGPSLSDWGTTTRRLTTTVPEELLRGVSLEHCLRMFGRVLSQKDGSDADHDMSKIVTELDDFISHDWQTGRCSKFFALCVVYNFRAALIASVVVGLVVGTMQLESVSLLPMSERLTGSWHVKMETFAGEVDGEIIPGFWCMLLCPIAFYTFLFAWQSIRYLCSLKLRMVFLDKVCIHQTNMSLKAKGIRSLAGFLNASNRLVILWSPRYFTRLWCSYELATWLSLGRGMDSSVYFLPVSLGVFIVSGVFVTWCFYLFVTVIDHRDCCVEYFFIIIPCASLPIFMSAVHFARHLAQDLKQLTNQVANFCIRDTSCFCCTNNHVQPDTGLELPCDRTLVYDALESLSAADLSCYDPLDAPHLTAFDKDVKKVFGPSVLRAAGRTRISYQSALMVMVPQLWIAFDRSPRYTELHVGLGMASSTYVATNYFCLTPCLFNLLLRILAKFDTGLRPRSWGRVWDFLVVTMVSLLGLPMLVILMIPPSAAAYFFCSFSLQVAVLFVYALLTAALFNGLPNAKNYLGSQHGAASESRSDQVSHLSEVEYSGLQPIASSSPAVSAVVVGTPLRRVYEI